METIILTFPQPINVSVQVGDTAYYTNDLDGTEIVLIGIITAISTYTITCDIEPSAVRPLLTSFILFSKTNMTNINSLTGYYAEAQLRNDSLKYAELYSVASEVFESSK